MYYKTILLLAIVLIISSACGQAPVIQPEQETVKPNVTATSMPLLNSPLSTPAVSQVNSPLAPPAKVQATPTPLATRTPWPTPTPLPTFTPTATVPPEPTPTFRLPVRKDGGIDYFKLIAAHTTKGTYYDGQGYLLNFRLDKNLFNQPLNKIIYLTYTNESYTTANIWRADINDISQKELLFSLDVPERDRILKTLLSPDGTLIAYTPPTETMWNNPFHGELWVIDTNGQNNRLLEANMFYRLVGTGQYFWSPDSQFLLYSTLDGKTYKVNVHTGEKTLLFDPQIKIDFLLNDGADIALGGWSPQNEIYLIWQSPDDGDNWTIYAIDSETTLSYTINTFYEKYLSWVKLSPDGQFLLVAAKDCPLFKLNPLQHQYEKIIMKKGCGFRWAPDSHYLIGDDAVIDLDFLRPNANRLAEENSAKLSFIFPKRKNLNGWSSNGQYLVYRKKTTIDGQKISATHLLNLATNEEQVFSERFLEVIGWLIK